MLSKALTAPLLVWIESSMYACVCATFHPKAAIKSTVFQKISDAKCASQVEHRWREISSTCAALKGQRGGGGGGVVAAVPLHYITLWQKSDSALWKKKNKTDKKLWAFLAFLYTRPTWALTQLRVPKDQLDHYFTVQTDPQESSCQIWRYQGQTTIRTEPKEGFTVCVRERKLHTDEKVLGLNNYYAKLLLHFHTHLFFFPAILSSLSISIGPYQEEPNRKSKFWREEWSGA